jgi:hypothetical protein
MNAMIERVETRNMPAGDWKVGTTVWLANSGNYYLWRVVSIEGGRATLLPCA